ncbi:regulator of G-protein signaling 11, partial [Schistocerca piceifrons]|uniref:regulator of G-protein signaling 11 n=1 Tax=Schistocerca piceifrons TaxID=274613 RepID=UPI001F5FC44E
MEALVREMQDAETGVPVRSQKLFLTSIPSAFMGYDLIEWLMERLNIEESAEAVHLANQLCQYGYYFPVSDSKNLIVKDDSSLYRFQTPYYWPWQHRMPDNVEYAIYLAKRTLRNKQRHGLEDYELDALTSLRKNLQNKWDFITMQAEEQVRLAKERKKGDKIVSDSQERAYWRVYRPPPGYTHHLEPAPVPAWGRAAAAAARAKRRSSDDVKREVDFLRSCLVRTRVKVSQALDNLVQHCTTYVEYDPLLSGVQPSNPWTTDDPAFWLLNSPLVEVPTEKRVKRWALSMEELVSDPTGLQEFTNYLRKEYSHENIRFWMAVNDLRRSAQSQIHRKVKEIFDEFLAPGAPCEINIDGKTMEKVHQELRTPTRFTFDSAAEHVYTLLLKKDCYPRFVRSEQYKALLAAGVQPLQKKRFFGFGGPAKKKSSTCNPPNVALLQQQMAAAAGGGGGGGSVGGGGGGVSLGRRRGSERSLSGSVHELVAAGVREPPPRVPHSHSQSNLSDIPYRGDLESRPYAAAVRWFSPDPAPTSSSKPDGEEAGVSGGGGEEEEDSSIAGGQEEVVVVAAEAAAVTEAVEGSPGAVLESSPLSPAATSEGAEAAAVPLVAVAVAAASVEEEVEALPGAGEQQPAEAAPAPAPPPASPPAASAAPGPSCSRRRWEEAAPAPLPLQHRRRDSSASSSSELSLHRVGVGPPPTQPPPEKATRATSEERVVARIQTVRKYSAADARRPSVVVSPEDAGAAAMAGA